jgi:hypothetical protein
MRADSSGPILISAFLECRPVEGRGPFFLELARAFAYPLKCR